MFSIDLRRAVMAWALSLGKDEARAKGISEDTSAGAALE